MDKQNNMHYNSNIDRDFEERLRTDDEIDQDEADMWAEVDAGMNEAKERDDD
jgi:hypothetical protein